MDISFLGAWGFAVLAVSMAGTQYMKEQLKACGIQNNWIFMTLPLLIAGLGACLLAVGEEKTGVSWRMVPLYWFLGGFGGNVIYKLWKRKAGLPE